MSSRIRVFAVGLLTIGLTGGVQALSIASPPQAADRIETCGLKDLVEGWLSSFPMWHRLPTSRGPKDHPQSSSKSEEKEGSHLDPNGQH